jgi:protein phosphatase
VGTSDGRVAIYQGVQQDLGPIVLSHLVEQTSIELTSLTVFDRQSVIDTISTNALADAQRVVARLSADEKN